MRCKTPAVSDGHTLAGNSFTRSKKINHGSNQKQNQVLARGKTFIPLGLEDVGILVPIGTSGSFLFPIGTKSGRGYEASFSLAGTLDGRIMRWRKCCAYRII